MVQNGPDWSIVAQAETQVETQAQTEHEVDVQDVKSAQKRPSSREPISGRI